MQRASRPCLGASLGFVTAVFLMALLWQLGVSPPDRLPLFGLIALFTFLGAWATTPIIADVKRTFVWIAVLCAASGALALAGIPEFVRGGYLTDGCFVEATSSLDTATPAQTSSRDPFDVTRDDVVEWEAASDGVFTNWDSSLGMRVGGFRVPLWSGSHENSGEAQMWSDVESTDEYVEAIQETTGIRPSGVYHASGFLDADQGSCELSAYVRIQPDHPFDGFLLIALWVLTLAPLVALVTVALRSRRLRSPMSPS